MPEPIYSEVLNKSTEYGALVFFLVAAVIGSVGLNVLFFLRMLKMMEKVISYGDRTNQTVEKITGGPNGAEDSEKD